MTQLDDETVEHVWGHHAMVRVVDEPIAYVSPPTWTDCMNDLAALRRYAEKMGTNTGARALHMTNTTHIQIITGTSYFSGAPVVGVAFKGDTDGVAFTKWADKVGKGGRPSTVRTLGRKTEAEAIARLTQDFQDWAVRSGLAIVWDKNVRRNAGVF